MSSIQVQDNKAAIRHLNEALNSGDPELIATTIDEVFQPDVLIRTPRRVDASGTELMKQLWAVLLRGFPDLQVEIEDLIAEEDKVVSRNTVTGTHRGEYMGVAPTGNSVTWNEIFIGRIFAGRIAETWGSSTWRPRCASSALSPPSTSTLIRNREASTPRRT